MECKSKGSHGGTLIFNPFINEYICKKHDAEFAEALITDLVHEGDDPNV